MNLRETKFYFENIFSTLWLETPVHYAGQDFDGAKHDAWVNPVYTPSHSIPNGISTTSNVQVGRLYIVCWAEEDVSVMDLVDVAVDFINTKVDKQLFRHRGYDVIDRGWDDSDKVFVVLAFTFEQLTGICVNSICEVSVGGTDGTSFELDGIWKPSCIIFKG